MSFAPNAARRVAQSTQFTERNRRTPPGRPVARGPKYFTSGMRLAYASSNVTEASGSSTIAYGFGQARWYAIDKDAGTIEPTGEAFEVLSDLDELIPTGAKLRLGWDMGAWWVVGYVCETEPEPE